VSKRAISFGKSTRISTSNPVLASDLSETYVDYLTSLFNWLRDSQELANENCAKQRAKTYYDRKINSKAFKRGNQVYLLKEPVKRKFAQYRAT